MAISNSPTFLFRVELDVHNLPKNRAQYARKLARAITRVIQHTTEVDIEGAEVLDQNIGQITVLPLP